MLKLDENLAADLADELTRRRHDVDTVLDEHLGGRTDAVVVRAESEEHRMVVASTAAWARLLRAHDLAGFSRWVVVVESDRVRVRRPEGEPE